MSIHQSYEEKVCPECEHTFSAFADQAVCDDCLEAQKSSFGIGEDDLDEVDAYIVTAIASMADISDADAMMSICIKKFPNSERYIRDEFKCKEF